MLDGIRHLRPPAMTTANPAEARATLAAIFFVAAVVCAQITAHLVDFGVYDLRIRALNSSIDSSAVAWVPPVALAVAALGSLGLSLRRRTERKLWLGLTAVLAFLSAAGALHFDGHVPHWRIVVAPILGAALVLLLVSARQLAPRQALLVRVGCVLLVASFSLHVFGAAALSALGWSASSWPYQIKIAMKQGTEIAGWLLVASALCISLASFARRPRTH